MSPEQAKGRPADKRSDIWAFGCVLYEMLTGKRAFDAEDVAETLALVMTRSPDSCALPTTVPAPVLRVLHRCLERDRRRRLADIADVRLEIDDAAIATPVAASLSASPRSRLRQWLGVVAGLLVVGAVAFAAWTIGRRTATTDDSVPVFRAEIPMPAALSGEAGSRFAISPDGRRLAFVAPASGGSTMLWVRALDTATAQPLAGTEGAAAPFWSPDSRVIAFTAGGKLKRIAETGGPIVTICDVEAAFPGAWNNDGVILFTPRNLSGLFRVPARGGSPTQATTPDQPNVRHEFPTFLLDGRHFVYYSSTANGSARQVRVAALDAQESKTIPVPTAATSPSFADGRLLYVSASTLFAQPIDTVRFELQRDADPVTEDIDMDVTGRFGSAFFRFVERHGRLSTHDANTQPAHVVRSKWTSPRNSWRTYDPARTRSLSNCVIQQCSDDTTVHGRNVATGSEWHKTAFADGSQSGVDHCGVKWTYDTRTTVYRNDAGEVRFGKQPFRIELPGPLPHRATRGTDETAQVVTAPEPEPEPGFGCAAHATSFT